MIMNWYMTHWYTATALITTLEVDINEPMKMNWYFENWHTVTALIMTYVVFVFIGCIYYLAYKRYRKRWYFVLAHIVMCAVLAYLCMYTYHWIFNRINTPKIQAQYERDMAWLDECRDLHLPWISGNISAHLGQLFLPIFIDTNSVPSLFYNRQYFPLTDSLVQKVSEEMKRRPKNMNWLGGEPLIVILANPLVPFHQMKTIYEYANAYQLKIIFWGQYQNFQSGGLLIEKMSQFDYDEVRVKIHEDFVEFNGEILYNEYGVYHKSKNMREVIFRVEVAPACSVQRVLTILKDLSWSNNPYYIAWDFGGSF